MAIVKTSIRTEASGVEVFEVKDSETNEVIGYDYVNPASANEEIIASEE